VSRSFELNLPDVVAEVRAAFERYELALVAKDLVVLSESFADLEEIVRFGIADRQHGPEELAAWRESQPAPRPGRALTGTAVTTYGRDVGIVTTLFSYPGRPMTGRQSQTWLRLAEGWRIVHAHVSEIPTDEPEATERGSTAR
jgi:hypothetical protein